ncbi:MAG: hypothetical protein HYT80_05930 [Euryarchaeota archaeon]|nr:hypothetical protein [Euryarchaeota archaeon]
MAAELAGPTGRAAFADTKGVPGAMILSGFVLMLVAGIVAIIWALQLVGPDRVVIVEVLSALVLGVLVIFGSVLVWYGRNEMGGILGIVSGIVFLVLGPETAGLFSVLGGLLVLVSDRVGAMGV